MAARRDTTLSHHALSSPYFFITLSKVITLPNSALNFERTWLSAGEWPQTFIRVWIKWQKSSRWFRVVESRRRPAQWWSWPGVRGSWPPRFDGGIHRWLFQSCWGYWCRPPIDTYKLVFPKSYRHGGGTRCYSFPLSNPYLISLVLYGSSSEPIRGFVYRTEYTPTPPYAWLWVHVFLLRIDSRGSRAASWTHSRFGFCGCWSPTYAAIIRHAPYTTTVPHEHEP